MTTVRFDRSTESTMLSEMAAPAVQSLWSRFYGSVSAEIYKVEKIDSGQKSTS
jgi:hypothetical protein